MPVIDYTAEQAVLGSMLQDSSIVSDALSVVKAEDFGDSFDRRLFEAARALFREGAPVDALTVLGKLGLDADADSRAKVAAILDAAPTATNWREYAGIMHDRAILSLIQAEALRINGALTLDDCREPVAAITSALHAGRGIQGKTLEELLCNFAVRQDPAYTQQERFETGFSQIDHLVKLTRGKFAMIAGQPSDGKTALALQWALRFAAKQSVGVFSLETDDDTVADRFVTHGFGIDYDKIVDQRMTDVDWVTFADKMPIFAKRNLRVFDESRLTAEQIAAVSTAYGFDAIFVDYGQLIETEHEKGATRAELLARVSQTLKIFAGETETLVVLLLQLKEPQKYRVKVKGEYKTRTLRPTMDDLGESRQWMKDADMIFILSRPDVDPDDTDNPYIELDYDKNRLLKVAKNKEGKRGTVTLYFDGLHQTFYINGQQPAARKPSDRGGSKQKEAGNPGQQSVFGKMQELPPDQEEGMPF